MSPYTQPHTAYTSSWWGQNLVNRVTAQCAWQFVQYQVSCASSARQSQQSAATQRRRLPGQHYTAYTSSCRSQHLPGPQLVTESAAAVAAAAAAAAARADHDAGVALVERIMHCRTIG
jgi:hypothetical protein